MTERMDAYASQVNSKTLRGIGRQAVFLLSLLVILGVFWCLKLTGITMAGEAFCGVDEHVHSEDCMIRELTCGMDESSPHVHDEGCLERRLICGCGDEESHIHDESCYLVTEGVFLCAREETDGHTHTEDCYEQHLQCPLTEHIHTESCYSDINADLEDESVWEESLRDVVPGTSTAQTLIAVARSQLGYQESALNFEVDLHGVRRGITRYGQWYGNPYGDWDAMFVSFCLSYAGAGALPANAGAEAMRLEWAQAGLYLVAEEYSPRAGNLIFLRGDAEDTAAAVALISAAEADTVTLIQGDVEGAVAEYTLPCDDPGILGYGTVPEASPYAMTLAQAADLEYIAQTVTYTPSMFTSSRSFVLYTLLDGVCYAIDGSGGAVPVEIGSDGSIRADVSDPAELLWSFTASGASYVIQNLSTGRHLHPFYNSASDCGVTTAGGWTTGVYTSGSGVVLQASAYARLNGDATAFEMTRDASAASVFQFGMAEQIVFWLDGTNGGLMSLEGSDKESFTVTAGSTVTLPSQWTSPEKYSYTMQGWYDVKNGLYYEAGAQVTIGESLLFYADWAAETYDIGQMNSHVVDTVSTSDFITTRVFDYNSLFNVLSLNNDYSGGDSTRWTLVEDGTVDVTGEETLNFIFIDYDDPGSPGAISYPVGRNQANGVDYSRVTSGLYTEELASLLFDEALTVTGKHYLGLGDHLFQYGDDPEDTEHYGYFYYDSVLNAASYHQSNGRFYVYDYLERTVDSAGNSSYSDFLPLNSPYANTNGKETGAYYYNGVHNEHVGTPHIAYDTKYSDSSNSPNRVITNFWFGMTMEMDFYLPSVPGTVDSSGILANQSITGEDMVFEFSGDDDVWVLIDGELVLDIGGIHGVEAGSIDFSTGDVIVDGVKTGSVTDLSSGSHTLTMYYLERGSSMSNFKLRFNLSTRYSLTLQKEDTLTAHLLDGAQFAVYTDAQCTVPAQLWVDRASHERGDATTNIFTVTGGAASMWGFAAGNTYYLEEIRGPDALDGEPAKGIIRMTLNNQGQPDYEILTNADGDLTTGYTVHGYKINEDTQEAFLVITNTDAADSEPTQVYVEKVWDDGADHSGDSITVYLLANGQRIQSATLSEGNQWKHLWVNLPKTDAEGSEVVYTVQEATVPGYVGTIEAIDAPDSGGGDSSSGSSGSVTGSSGFVSGQTYLLQTRFGYIGASGGSLLLESSQDSALTADACLWTATVNSDGTVTLTNRLGQTLYYESYTFRVSSSPGTYKNLTFADGTLSCFIDHGGWSETQYPVDNDSVPSNVTYNGVFYTTNTASGAMAITPLLVGGSTEPEPEPETPSGDGSYYRITNTPAGDATISLKVNKLWDTGSMALADQYEALTVQVRLLADGADAGLTGTLNLRNGWSHTFEDLPKFDSGGREIVYTVEEADLPEEWHPVYGAVVSVGGSETAYETTITNVYHMTVELPSTGGIGPYGYTTLGGLIMLGSLGWYCGKRHKSERREC